jgi:hypothetical protein
LPISVANAANGLDRVRADEGVLLKHLKQICIPAEPSEVERSMAKVLQEELKTLYEIKLTVVSATPPDGRGAVFLGRRAAIASGMIRDEDLDAVKFDGFVATGCGNRIAVAGYAPQGTIYGTHALLRHVGLKTYPWRSFGAVRVLDPVEDGNLKPFRIASKPFFSRRDLLGYLDQGRWGASLREYSLGEFRFVHDHEYFKGKGWLGGDHTAPYLVPMAKYYEDHPEYFAMKGGERIEKDTQNVRVALCLSNPDVHRIATDRALEWMSIQRHRRFFHVTDGDTAECECPQCVALDPHPDSYTDRYLKWVNSVARAVKETYPDNAVLALAYANATREPVLAKPESNVVVMYCPWYWTTRTTSAVSWANPLNVTAMKQFMGWSMMFPGQIGLYDYPGSWVYGQAERIKFLAKNDARVFYSCGGNGDLFQWVNANLLVDPFLDTELLVSEFASAYYGPAAEPMGRYLELRRNTIERNLVHTRFPFRDVSFLQTTRELIQKAEDRTRGTDDGTSARILASALDAYHLVLQNSHLRGGGRELRNDSATYRRDIEHYVGIAERLHKLYKGLGNAYVLRTHVDAFRETMQTLGIKVPTAESEEVDGDESIYSRTLASLGEQLKELAEPRQEEAQHLPITRSIRFDSHDEAEKWIVDASRAESISPPKRIVIDCPSGDSQTGVGLRAPFTELPIIPLHNVKIHAGRFFADRILDPPMDATGCQFVDFHIHASCDVPITVYINEIHSDVDLHAGEQIVRVDMRNFDRKGRFTYAEWDKKIHRISFDLWPQDNYHPYTNARDTQVVIFGVMTSNQKPVPSALPHRGRAIWLSQFRPNLKRGISIPRGLYDQYLQRQRYKHVGLDYGSRWLSEGFRTFTEHRAVSPIFAILTSEGSSPAEQEAARKLQAYLEKMFGVRLPINPEGTTISRYTSNAILLGKEACLATGRVLQRELQHVGPRGFTINAHNGRIAIAGAGDIGTLQGVTRYLEDHAVRLFASDRIRIPDMQSDMLHELYLLDWPYFDECPVRTLWAPTAERMRAKDADSTSVAAAEELALTIKDLARAGREEVPPSLLKRASQSPLAQYTAVRLLWDPYTDATRLIRQFRERNER